MPLPKRTCRKCGDEFTLMPNKPGNVNDCLNCAEEDVPRLVAKVAWSGTHCVEIEITPDAAAAAAFNSAQRRSGPTCLSSIVEQRESAHINNPLNNYVHMPAAGVALLCSSNTTQEHTAMATKKKAAAPKKAAAEPKKVAAPAPEPEPAPAVDLVPTEKGSDVPKMPDLYNVWLDSAKAPANGSSHYFLLHQTTKRAVLFHPPSLTVFTIPAEDMRGSKVQPLDGTYKLTPARIADSIEARMLEFSKMGRQYPEQVTRRVVAALRQLPIANVPQFKPTREMPAALKAHNERRHEGPVHVIRTMLTAANGATREEILAVLVKRFPERNAKSMQTTLSGRLRDGCNSGKPATATTDKVRGTVYHLEA